MDVRKKIKEKEEKMKKKEEKKERIASKTSNNTLKELSIGYKPQKISQKKKNL